MKIVLKQNVEKLGVKGEIKEVKPGFARNFLITKKLAVPATFKEIQSAKKMQDEIKRRKQQLVKNAEINAKKLNNKKIEIAAQANEEGILFGAISAKDIANAIKTQLKTEIDEKTISLSETIKKTGNFKIKIKLSKDFSADLKLKILKK